MSSPLFTQSRLAQVSEGFLSTRRSSGSSSVDYVTQRRFSRDTLASFKVDSVPTVQELYELQLDLDDQCLHLAAGTDLHPKSMTFDANSVVEIAVFLSGPLSQARFPGTFLFQEIQLRTLVSCLALLYYHEVEALYPAKRDKLCANISSYFGQIAFQLPSLSTLSAAIRYAPNVYLLQLVSQYLSFIQRGDSKLPSVVGPIVKIFFGCVSLGAHQYNHIQQILEGLTELSSLWQRPQNRYKALFGLQEYTRLASTLCRQSPQIREASTVIVRALLSKIGELLSKESTPSMPKLGDQWPKMRHMMNFGPPNLDQGYYFFGLLDCSTQLVMSSSPGMVPMEFIEKMKRLVYETTVPEYRWKAIEMLLSCHSTRERSLHDLRVDIETTAPVSIRDKILEEISVIHELLDNDAEAGLKVSSRPPVSNNKDQLRIDILGHSISETVNPSSDVGIAVFPRLESPYSISTVEPDWQEPSLLRSHVKATRSFSVQFPRATFFGARRSYTPYAQAGVSSDGNFVYFYEDAKICLCRTAGLGRKVMPANEVLEIGKDFTDGEPILDVIMSQRYLLVMTNRSLRIVNVYNNKSLESIKFGDWGPGGMACRETEAQLVVALGCGQGNSLMSSNGRVQLFNYDIDSLPMRLAPRSTLNLPPQSRPKRIYLDQGWVLTCVTTIQSKLVVWDLDEGLSALRGPLEFVKNHYSVERYETGITSVSLYTTLSEKRYLLATTSPSSERHRNEGEWSFSLPLPSVKTANTPKLRPPSNTVHIFEQFRTHRALRAGTVSHKHNIFAVMEENGRISLLPLMAAEGGGVCGANDDITLLDDLKGGMGGCLRFIDDGERLVAVDAKGRGLVVEFERE